MMQGAAAVRDRPVRGLPRQRWLGEPRRRLRFQHPLRVFFFLARPAFCSCSCTSLEVVGG